jgi:hypothetical protein
MAASISIDQQKNEGRIHDTVEYLPYNAWRRNAAQSVDIRRGHTAAHILLLGLARRAKEALLTVPYCLEESVHEFSYYRVPETTSERLDAFLDGRCR